MSFFVYVTCPIDLYFQNLKTVEETRRFIGFDGVYVGCSVKDFDDDWESAKETAEEYGLFGPYRHAPHVFWLPMQDRFEYGFVIKQNENGVTYVISPRELSYLEQTS